MTRKLSISVFCALLCAFVLSFQTNAQGLSSDDVKAQMVRDWERAKTFTVDYLNTMPTNKYSFRAVDSIRSFAQQMLHLAAGNYFLMSNATELAAPAFLASNIQNSPSAQNKDSVMWYVTNSYDYCINAVKNCDPSKWAEKKALFGFECSRWALMNKTFEHQGHHRAQTTIYIRLQGIKPPEERLF